MDSGVWQIFRADCTVILRYCKSKSGKKCRSYCTLNHQRILNLQFAQFFKGLKRGLLDEIRCSQWLQGMVLDGIKGFQWKNSGSMTFNFKSDAWSCVLPQIINPSTESALAIRLLTFAKGQGTQFELGIWTEACQSDRRTYLGPWAPIGARNQQVEKSLVTWKYVQDDFLICWFSFNF